jgi:phosphatidylglycerol---prolipoprotein diacylglyceryl transferase
MITITPLKIQLWGPLALHGYGIAVAVGIILFVYLSYNHFRQHVKITFDTVSGIVTNSIFIGLLGGRTLHVISDWQSYNTIGEFFAIYNGGLSILGCFIALAIYVPYALWKNNLPLLLALDTAALFAPLAHAIGRLGCLWAGCCFGCSSTLPWSVSYAGHTSGAPLGIGLHPTQLYSSLIFFMLFVLLYYVILPYTKKPGTLTLCYIVGMSLERFAMDFVRNDRLFFASSIFSIHQWIALILISITLLIAIIRKTSFARTLHKAL